jgi:hypothetical protein
MNILIAGIISVIMLLVGGAGYYRHNQNVYRDHMMHELITLEQTPFGRLAIIRTEEQFEALLTFCPLNVYENYIVGVNDNFTAQRVRQIIESHYTDDLYISTLFRHFIRGNHG